MKFTEGERVAEIRRLVDLLETDTFEFIMDEPYGTWIPESLAALELGLSDALVRKLVQMADHRDDFDSDEDLCNPSLESQWIEGRDRVKASTSSRQRAWNGL